MSLICFALLTKLLPGSDDDGKKELKITVPSRLVSIPVLALSISFAVPAILFLISYLIWYGIFYILATVLIIATLYRAFTKEKGIILQEEQDKKLFQLVRSVSEDLRVRMPDKIILTPYSGIGVSGIFKRTLSIGVATLNSLTTIEFYSILFHEFAHYRGRDNIVGSSLMRLTYAFRDTVSAARYIPTIFGLIVWGFLAIFYYIFAAATLLYSRQREYLADWFAAYFVGGKTFGNALDRYVKSSHLFDIQVNPIMHYHMLQRQLTKNIYEETNSLIVKFDENLRNTLEKNLKEMYEKTSAFSTHPATKTRIEKLVSIEGILKSLPEGYCSDLFENFKNYEEQLTRILFESVICGNIVRSGTESYECILAKDHKKQHSDGQFEWKNKNKITKVQHHN